MPNRPPVACNFPACKKIALAGSSYCEDHKKIPVTSDKPYTSTERREENPYRALYDTSAYRKHLRPFILQRDPLCKGQYTDLCKQHGGDGTTILDHIRDHKGDPALFFDPANCRGLCKPCHDFKTGKTSNPGANPENQPVATGEDGVQYVATSDAFALEEYMRHYEDENFDDIKIP
jgi:5-methylcytosine-specific restriction protein A